MTRTGKAQVGKVIRRFIWVAGAIIAILALVATVALFTVSRELRRARDSHAEVQHTREVLEGVQKILSAMQDAETGQRGFLITNNAAFLEPYHAAKRSLEELLTDLEIRIQDPQARRTYDTLVLRTHEQMEALNGIIALQKAGNSAEATSIEVQGDDKRRMDVIRGLVARLQERQKSLLDARLATFTKTSYQSERDARLALGAAVLLALVCSILLARNYLQRCLAESANQEHTQRLRATLDSIADAIVTIDEQASIESWSKGAETMFGYTADEVLHRNVSMLMPEARAAAHGEYLRQYDADTGEKRFTQTRREHSEAKRKDGHCFPVEIAVTEMHIDSSRMFIVSVCDISLRHEVDQLKSGFVSAVSHELRTPLTSISGSLGLLAAGTAGRLPDKAQRLVDIALSNSERLVRLINDILDLEKSESGKMEFDLATLRIRPIVQQAIEMKRGHAQSLGVTVDLDPACGDAAALVDRDRLTQVLTNLLSNAAKFSSRDGVVRVRVGTDAGNVRVEIQDDGPGISLKFRKRIFQKFAQGDSTDARAKGGTGLGLSISKTLIERLGGSIGFASEPGQGTTFYFTLPQRRLPAETPASVSDKLSAPSVLLCEADRDIAAFVGAELTSKGMRVEAVASAQAARAAFDNDGFDIVVMDVDLPDADGLDFIAELRSRSPNCELPIIVATGRARSGVDCQRRAELHLAGWLKKPVDVGELSNLIGARLSKDRQGRATVLHVEDDESLVRVVQETIGDGFDVAAVHSLAEAREMIHSRRFDAVILDIALGDGSGLELLPQLQTGGCPPIPVILYSATEVSRELADTVQFAMVKSRHSVTQVLGALREMTA